LAIGNPSGAINNNGYTTITAAVKKKKSFWICVFRPEFSDRLNL